MSMPNFTGAMSRSAGNRTGQVGDFSIGKSKGGYRPTVQQEFTPEQMQLYRQMFGHLGPDSFLGRLAGGDEAAFEQMEAPAWRDLQGALGGMASRFSGMGAGARNSSGFKNTMGQMGSNFAQDLQSKRVNLQRESLNDLMGMSQMLMGQRPYKTDLMEKPQSFLEKLFGGIFGAGANAFGGWATGRGLGGGGFHG